VEQGETAAFFRSMAHPYSMALAAAAEPRLRRVRPRPVAAPVL